MSTLPGEPKSQDPRLQRLIDFYEQLQPAHLDKLDRIYSDDVRFKDPFNDVSGLPAVRHIFSHMFATVQAPRFVVQHAVSDAGQGFLTWDFHFSSKGSTFEVHGATRVTFADDGRVALHRDYWDVAEELYEKLPVLGSLMRWLKRRARG